MTAVTSIVSQEGVVRKTQFPRLVIPLAVVLTTLFNLALNLVVVFVFILAWGIDPTWTWLLFPVVLALLFVLTTAVSMIVSVALPALSRHGDHLGGAVDGALLRDARAVPDRGRARDAPRRPAAQPADPAVRAGAALGDRPERARARSTRRAA